MKTGRNEPCLCGSGKKFKKCCLLIAEQAGRMCRMPNGREPEHGSPGLKNDFRKEVEKEGKDPVELEADLVGEPEMLRRDQFVTMRQLQVEEAMRTKDNAYSLAAAEQYGIFLEELVALPVSAAREGVTAMIEKQIEALEKQAAASRFPRPNVVTLSALEAVLRIPQAEPIEDAASAESADDATEEETSPELRDEESESAAAVK